MVDNDHKFSAKKEEKATGKEKVVRLDHFPFIVMLEGMPKAKLMNFIESRWNLSKPNGWKAYNNALEIAAKWLEGIVEAESLPEDEIVKKFDAIAKKAFGK